MVTSTSYTDAQTFSILALSLTATSRSDLEPHLTRLREMDDVKVVRLGGNSLGVDACVAIGEVLKEKKGLEIADFADIFTGRLISEIPLALSALCSSLSTHPSLVELDLSDNAFGGRCADAMVPFLETNQSMKTFKLNNNGLGIWGGQVVSKAILKNAEQVKKSGRVPALREIVCGRNRLENGSASHWAEAFSSLPNLENVRLPQNGIRMEGISALAKGLQNCPNLKVLDLQDNTATESGTRAISASIPYWPLLETLNLSDCLLGPKGGISLATSLSKGHTPNLKVLRLQYGEFDSRAIHILARAIEEHLKQLEKLELNGNRADPEDECLERVRDALMGNGFADALDELDDMEDPEEEEDDDESDQEASVEKEEEKEDEVESPLPTSVTVLTNPKSGETTVVEKDDDDLADRLGGVTLVEQA